MLGILCDKLYTPLKPVVVPLIGLHGHAFAIVGCGYKQDNQVVAIEAPKPSSVDSEVHLEFTFRFLFSL